MKGIMERRRKKGNQGRKKRKGEKKMRKGEKNVPHRGLNPRPSTLQAPPIASR